MKIQYKSALLMLMAIVGLSIYARGGGGGGGRGGGGGFHGGGFHGGGGGFRGGAVRGGNWNHGGWNRGGWNRGGWGYDGWGWGPAVGFGVDVSSAPAPVNCTYATPGAPYYQYKRQYTDPINDQMGYQNWLKATYGSQGADYWNQFQAYLDYRACSKASSKPNVGFSVGVGTGGYPYRRW